MKLSVIVTLGAALAVSVALAAAPLLAQQTQLDVHGNYVTGTSTHRLATRAGFLVSF